MAFFKRSTVMLNRPGILGVPEDTRRLLQAEEVEAPVPEGQEEDKEEE